jgi:hypothetical protein
MNEKIFEHVNEVRDEANVMLENLSTVRGERHARLVRSLLQCSNVMEIYSACVQMGDLPDEAREVFGAAMCRAVYGVITNMAVSANFTPEELEEATKDAAAMDWSISGLMRDAVRAGADGTAFGGTKA